MAKNFVSVGAWTHDCAFYNGERQFWQRFSGLFSALVKLLFGTIILSPDLLGPVAIERRGSKLQHISMSVRRRKVELELGKLKLTSEKNYERFQNVSSF